MVVSPLNRTRKKMDTETGLCYGPGSIAGAVMGTLFTTIFLLIVTALLYRQWRRQKGKHLVLVTDPEIVDDAYAFDNPCFKDATPVQSKIMGRPTSNAAVETSTRDTTKGTTPWSGLGITSNRHGKRRTLDDSCLGSKTTRISVVSLRSRDFTGLGFNVCGNMREGIFVKDLLHRGPASESGKIHPGDRIAGVKISFRTMVYEDALTILSYASPYDVELEVESGGSGSRPTTLLKKSVGSSPIQICHPLYRSQSIPELSCLHQNSAKRSFIADPNESIDSIHSKINLTMKSSKSNPGSHTLERKHDESKINNHHRKFGIKVLPALDGAIHRIENENEHNTNLERKHSKRINFGNDPRNPTHNIVLSTSAAVERVSDRRHQDKNTSEKISNGIDLTADKILDDKCDEIVIPLEVPAEVHNAALAARRNRKNSAELLSRFKSLGENHTEDKKSPQRNKRKAPAPPVSQTKDHDANKNEPEERIDVIADYTESLNDYVSRVREATANNAETCVLRSDGRLSDRKNSESDTDSAMHHSFTTIELNSSDITIHHTPVPRVDDDHNNDNDNDGDDNDHDYHDNDDDDVYRKAASLGDLSKYEVKESATLERAQSLDIADAGSKKRKVPLPPPDDITDFDEDSTKLEDNATFDQRKLKKSSDWGTLEDAVWKRSTVNDDSRPKARKKSCETLERSASAIQFECKDVKFNNGCVELYNLPPSKSSMTKFIHTERMFNLDGDNSLSRIGEVIQRPEFEEMELDFRQVKTSPDSPGIIKESSNFESFDKAFRHSNLHARLSSGRGADVDLSLSNSDDDDMYDGMRRREEESVDGITINRTCSECGLSGKHDERCAIHGSRNLRDNSDESLKLISTIEPELFDTIEEQIGEDDDIVDHKENNDRCGIGLHVTVNRNRLSSPVDRHNVSRMSVSSGENSEDSGLVGGSGDYSTDGRLLFSNTLVQHHDTPRELTYVTEIEVLPIGNTKEPKSNEFYAKPPRSQMTIVSHSESLPIEEPPVPPKRYDASRTVRGTKDKPVVYVSEFESTDGNKNDKSDKVDQIADKTLEH